MTSPDPTTAALPRRRAPLAPRTPPDAPASWRAVRDWYERELDWRTAPACGGPVELLTGLCFDVLELPADAGNAVARRVSRTGPVAVHGSRMFFLVAPGAADELPGLLDWLDWGGVPLELTALGVGDRMPAPLPAPHGDRGSRETAVWVRPPSPGGGSSWMLPSLGLRRGEGARGSHGLAGGAGRDDVRGDADTPDLVRLVSAAATECHRARLLRVRRNDVGRTQPLAFSYASRTAAGTRPRSLTS
ncbi:SCO3374 family protein [Streptomyces sp. NPDC057702]|uniref:SCO3374 family protein n=1 Tax=unclassified Streptomyces TaxID=2593676 RepID=UPI0036A76DCA